MNFICIISGHVPDLAASIAKGCACKSICTRCKKHIYYSPIRKKWWVDKYWQVKTIS